MSEKTPDTVFGNWFGEAGDPSRNPVNLARAAMRAPLPERFYKDVSIAEEGGLHHLLLDGRKARTPSKNPLALPNSAAAQLVAQEWDAQKRVIDPATMHATRIVNTAIDHVGSAMPAVGAEIAKFASSDLICYRAGEPEALVERQCRVWDPLVAWAKADLDVRLILSEGVMFVEQFPETVERLGALVLRIDDPIALSALHVLTTLSGSLILSLAVERGRLDAASAYDASDLEADFTAEIWGEDEEAMHRRAARKREFEAAAALLRSVGGAA